jgi:hypothetical protein
MLTPEELKILPEGIASLYAELSEFILQDISRRIAKGARITDTAEFQIYRAQSLSMSNRQISNRIAEINRISAQEVTRLYREAAERSDMFDRRVLRQLTSAGVPLSENLFLQQLIVAQGERTAGDFANFTRTMGFVTRENGRAVHTALSEMYVRELDMAHMKIATGAVDYNSAIQAAYNKLAASGVRHIDYKSGISRELYTAVRQSVLHGTSQITQNISEQNAAMFGADGWELSAHAGARPDHAEHQGKQFSASQYESIVLPLVSDYGCRHSAFPIILGLSEPMYTDEELRNIDPPPFTYEGKTYTAYEASAQQRLMEREMRRQKNLAVCAKASGDEDAFRTASIKLARQKEVYADFSQKAGLFTQYERTQVYGFDRSVSAFSRAEVKRELDKYTRFVYNRDGTIRITDDWTNRNVSRFPTEYKPFAVIETMSNGQIDRTFYDENSMIIRQVHSGDHGSPLGHPYGKNGEHAHDFNLSAATHAERRITRELTDVERKENDDIL